jgi:hypothetical protein
MTLPMTLIGCVGESAEIQRRAACEESTAESHIDLAGDCSKRILRSETTIEKLVEVVQGRPMHAALRRHSWRSCADTVHLQ